VRQVHCHSYRQDEILAFLRVCEEFGVKVGTLQHILEGYKVADAIAKHGAAASSFSDWWAYKFEVYDAIPYNGQILRDAGVLVSFNSDDAELARRLNLEAAKAVKYGKVPEEEALKFVTLNPAKQLGIDKRVGSIEVGKDADLVVWSGPPLSTLSRCEQTWVDGRRYFDRTEDQAMRKRDADRQGEADPEGAGRRANDAGGRRRGGGRRQAEPRERDRWTREDLFCGCRTEGGK
jgi:N-acetylglucosamine-6-phosphate deacetylase